MKNSILCSCFIFIMSCNTEASKTQTDIASLDIQGPKFENALTTIESIVYTSEPYELKLQMNTLSKDIYDLVVSMQLNDGAHFVSPNAKRDFKGKFTIFINESNELGPISKLIETPRSVEEYDPHPFINGHVNWVRENATYTQKFKRTSDDNFHVKGYIQFTIEPRCTLENIPIIIKYYNGKMRIELFGC